VNEDRFVAFVTVTDDVRAFSRADEGYSPLASVRLRLLIPAAAVAGRVRVLFVPLQVFAADPSLAGLGRPLAIVLGKLSTGYLRSHRAEIEAMLLRMADPALAPALFADVTDDLAAMGEILGEAFLGEFQAGLARHCTLTAPCEALAARLRPLARRGVHVIEDPWESPRANPPRAPRQSPVRLCWFGNLGDTNHAFVADSLASVAARLRGRAAQLAVVAGSDRARQVAAIAEQARAQHPALAVTFIPWSLAATWQAIDDCDIVLLPQEAHSDWGRVKSHNRLVEAIRGGRLAVASPIPSYRELADFAWVGDSLAEGVDWALANPEAAAARVAAGQALIGARFSPEAVGRRWVEVLGVGN